MNYRILLLALPLLASACDALPKDPDGTLNRIRAEKIFKVGLIGSGPERADADRQQAMLGRIAAATGARPMIEEDAAEPLLTRLEEGHLDLVMGELSPKSPWSKQVAIIPQFAEEVSPEGHVHLVVAAKNGENAWIELLHRQARQVAAKP